MGENKRHHPRSGRHYGLYCICLWKRALLDRRREKKAESGKDKKMSVTNTLACSAFAEAGEPCPIEGKKRINSTSLGTGPS